MVGDLGKGWADAWGQTLGAVWAQESVPKSPIGGLACVGSWCLAVLALAMVEEMDEGWAEA